MADTKKCPFCAEEIKADAIVCRFCRRELDPASQFRAMPTYHDPSRPKVPSNTGRGVAIGVTAAIILVGGVIALSQQQAPEAPAAAAPSSAPVATNSAAAPSAWYYSQTTAALSDRLQRMACVTSDNEISIGTFGQTTAKLCLLQGGGFRNSAFIDLDDDRGQFVCSIDECSIRARLDGGAIQRFSGDDTSVDYQDHTLYICNGARLATLLKHANRATFAVTIFEGGEQELTFPVRGLVWN